MSKDRTAGIDRRRLYLVGGLCALGAGLGVARYVVTQPQPPAALRSGAGNRAEFLCPCHSSKYDLAGRVFRMGPAPANLVIPEYRLEGDSRVVIGEA